MNVHLSLACLILSAASGLAQDAKDIEPRAIDPGPPPSDAVVLFGGKDVSRWQTRDGKPCQCQVREGAMVCKTGVGDIVSRELFRSAQIHLEVNIPNMPEQKGQLRGNSGIYLQGRYEIQILDSYRNPTYGHGAAAGLYGQAPPLVIASRPPEQWQSYDIVFHAPQCDASGQLTRRGTVTVLFNGVLVQDHVEIQNTGKGCVADRLGDPGPLLLQDHSGFKGAPVTEMKFRNIWFRRLD